MEPHKFVKEYQCPGCMCGEDCFTQKSHEPGNITCAKHHPATYIAGIGKIILGMPKGFNRLGPDTELEFDIFLTYKAFMQEFKNTETKYCVVVWRYRNKEGHVFLRIYNPRTNTPQLVVITEDCLDKFTCCIEITEDDIKAMD